jgi:hypothetical protein
LPHREPARNSIRYSALPRKSITSVVDPKQPFSLFRPAPALFLALAALFVLGAPARRAGRAAGDEDCVVGRDTGTAAPACYALNIDSPYATAGIGGTRIGADAAALDRMAACVQAGDTRSAGCAMGPLSAPGVSLPQAPSGFRLLR